MSQVCLWPNFLSSSSVVEEDQVFWDVSAVFCGAGEPDVHGAVGGGADAEAQHGQGARRRHQAPEDSLHLHPGSGEGNDKIMLLEISILFSYGKRSAIR